MKRRLLSALLAALILVGLLPAGAMIASAASTMTASDEAITLLKSWEGFLAYPQWDNSQYTIGYGTSCDPDDYPNGITREQAEVLLKEHLITFETSVNSFADKNGLTFNQNQFDALVLFSYNVGTAWMSQGNNIRDAVIQGMTGNEFIFYLTRWCISGGKISTGHINRRLAEADIYLNGYYATKAPDCFTYVLFNGNGGIYTYNVQGYNATEPVDVKATAVLDGSTFLGWYTAKDGGQWITTLDSTTKGKTLYAHWQEGQGNVDETGKILGTAADYARITAVALKVYAAPSADAQVVASVNANSQVVITADYVDAAGVKWGKLENGNWVDLTNTKAIVIPDAAPDRSNSVTLGSGSKDEENEEEPFSVSVTVTGSLVNFRKGPGTNYAKLGTLSAGQQIIISEVVDVDGTLWGKFSFGWVSLMYTDYDEVIQSGNTGSTVVATGTVISTGALRIRSGAGTEHATVGTLNSGAKIKIYEIVYKGDTPWGRIANGWVCLTYVHYTMGDNTNPPADGDNKPDTDASGTPVNIYGWVTAVALNVREQPGASQAVVTRLSKDDYVHITELVQIGGTKWGKVAQGWICMDFILIDTKNSGTDIGDIEVPDQGGNSGAQQPDNTPSDVITGVVKASNLCVRSAPGTNNPIVTTIPNGTKVTVRQQTLVNGVVWGQIDQGWICMTYVNIISAGNVPVCSGMVTASTLCIRTAAGTGNAIVGTYSRGELVEILQITSVNGTKWGRTDKGWISMDYVQVTVNPGTGTVPPVPETPEQPSEPVDPEEPETPEQPSEPGETPDQGENNEYVKGVVTASNLCVRSTPGTTGAIVTTIPNGTEVTVRQQTLIDGVVWGKIDQGWICMTYVQVTVPGNIPVCTGMVTASQLSIRAAAGTTNAIVGTYMRGDLVQILEITKVNKTYWGRTDKGWISMDYVQTTIMPDVDNTPEPPAPETPDDGGSTEPPEDGGSTETPDDGGNSGDDSGSGDDSNTGTGDGTNDDDNTGSGEQTGSAFAFTADECVAAINAALQSEQAKIVARGNEDGVLTYELVDTLDEGSLGVMIGLELAEDGQHVAGIVLISDANDADASNNLFALSVMAMSMLDSTITDADLEQMVSGDPETDESGAMYYIMERESGIYAFILDVNASLLYFCVYPAA